MAVRGRTSALGTYVTSAHGLTNVSFDPGPDKKGCGALTQYFRLQLRDAPNNWNLILSR